MSAENQQQRPENIETTGLQAKVAESNSQASSGKDTSATLTGSHSAATGPSPGGKQNSLLHVLRELEPEPESSQNSVTASGTDSLGSSLQQPGVPGQKAKGGQAKPKLSWLQLNEICDIGQILNQKQQANNPTSALMLNRTLSQMHRQQRDNLFGRQCLVKLQSIASMNSPALGAQQSQMQAPSPLLPPEESPLLPQLEKQMSQLSEQQQEHQLRRNCLAQLAREQERLIEKNLQQLLQSEVSSANHGSSEEDQLVEPAEDVQGFPLAFNQELLSPHGRGIRDSDSLGDDDEEEEEEDYVELLQNALMRERSEVFGQAEKSLLYRSLLNSKKGDNAAGPKFIRSDLQEKAEKSARTKTSEESNQATQPEPTPQSQWPNAQPSKFDTTRYFKPTFPLPPNQMQMWQQQDYQQMDQGQLLPFAPMQQMYVQKQPSEDSDAGQFESGGGNSTEGKRPAAPSATFTLPKVRFECCDKLGNMEIQCECVLIDKVSQLDILDEIMALQSDEIVGVNVQMNADVLNENFQIDVFGPSLLTLGSTFKTYIIDFVRLSTQNNQRALDKKLCQIFQEAPVIFAGFGVPTLITYFHQFHQNFYFLRSVPRIIDVRIMYHKVQRKGQRSFATIYQILFAKRLDITENLSDWEQRPLTPNQLKQTGVEVQSLLRMIYKLERLSKTKDKARFRVYMHEIISKIENYQYIDNPLVYNKFTKADLKISAINRRQRLNKAQRKEQLRELRAMKYQQQQAKTEQSSPETSGMEAMMQAQEQLQLLELVEAITGVKLTPNVGHSMEHQQYAPQNLGGLPQQVPVFPAGANLQYSQGGPMQMGQGAAMGLGAPPQQFYVNQNVNFNLNFNFAGPQPVPNAFAVQQTQQPQATATQVLDSLPEGARPSQKKEGMPFLDQDLNKIKPFEPQNQSKSAGLAQASGLAQELEKLELGSQQNSQEKAANYGSLYEDVKVEEVERSEPSAEARGSGVMYNLGEPLGGPATSLGLYASFQERNVAGRGGQLSQPQSVVELPRDAQDLPGPMWASQQPKSRSGVAGHQKSSSKSTFLAEKASDGASDGKARGVADLTATPAERPVFRRKQPQNLADSMSPEALHANEILNEKRKLSKEARARERKVMLEERKRKTEGLDKRPKAVKSARGPTAMSAQSLQQLTGYSVQVGTRRRRQKAQLKESAPSGFDERMQRQALADQKRRLMKELQEREEAQLKQPSPATPTPDTEEEAAKKA